MSSDRQRIRYKSVKGRKNRSKLVLEDVKGGNGDLIGPIFVLALVGAGVYGYINRCKFFHICGNNTTTTSSQPQQHTKSSTKNKSKKKRKSSSNYTSLRTVDLANGMRYHNLVRLAV